MATTLTRKNRQRSGYSFPRPRRSTIAGRSAGQLPFAKRYSNEPADSLYEAFGITQPDLRPPSPTSLPPIPLMAPPIAPPVPDASRVNEAFVGDTDRIDAALAPFREVNRARPAPASTQANPGLVPLPELSPTGEPLPLIPGQGMDPIAYEMRRRRGLYQAETAALDPGPVGHGPASREGAARVQPQRAYSLPRQAGITAGYAAADAAKEAQRAQQTREGIQQMYGIMDRLGVTPGSEQIAEITGGPVEDYALNPETGRALKTYRKSVKRPGLSQADLAVKREKYKTGRKLERAAERKTRQDRLAFNAMARTPAGLREIMMEQVARAKQAEISGLLADIGVPLAARQQPVNSSGNVIPSDDADSTLRALLQRLTGGEVPVPGAAVGARGAPSGPLDFPAPSAPVLDSIATDDALTRFSDTTSIEDRDGAIAYLIDKGYEEASVLKWADETYTTSAAGDMVRGLRGGIAEFLGTKQRPLNRSTKSKKPSSTKSKKPRSKSMRRVTRPARFGLGTRRGVIPLPPF